MFFSVVITAIGVGVAGRVVSSVPVIPGTSVRVTWGSAMDGGVWVWEGSGKVSVGLEHAPNVSTSSARIEMARNNFITDLSLEPDYIPKNSRNFTNREYLYL